MANSLNYALLYIEPQQKPGGLEIGLVETLLGQISIGNSTGLSRNSN